MLVWQPKSEQHISTASEVTTPLQCSDDYLFIDCRIHIRICKQRVNLAAKGPRENCVWTEGKVGQQSCRVGVKVDGYSCTARGNIKSTIQESSKQQVPGILLTLATTHHQASSSSVFKIKTRNSCWQRHHHLWCWQFCLLMASCCQWHTASGNVST